MEYACSPSFCDWVYHTIYVSSGAGNDTALYTGLKYDANGTPYIVYHNLVSGGGQLNLAYPVNSGGNCGVGVDAGKWRCDTIQSGTDAGNYPAMDMNGNHLWPSADIAFLVSLSCVAF